MHEQPTCLEMYVYVPRGVGTADTTTLSITRCAFKSVFSTAASLYVTVLHMHQTTLNRSAVIDHDLLIVIITGVGGGGGDEEEK